MTPEGTPPTSPKKKTPELTPEKTPKTPKTHSTVHSTPSAPSRGRHLTFTTPDTDSERCARAVFLYRRIQLPPLYPPPI